MITHRAECDLLQRGYPDVSVEPDAIFVQDGNVWTSAGVTARIDLALALAAGSHHRRPLGHRIAICWVGSVRDLNESGKIQGSNRGRAAVTARSLESPATRIPE